VLDADGLNALADHPQGLADGAGPRIVTPHVGEFKRLVGRADRELEVLHKAAVDVAARHGLVVVLKHHRTFVTDGGRVAVNATGNPGMATGGAGDVLTGIIVALLCQGLPPWEAARLAVHVHGLAGDCAADALTQVAMTARDLVRYLPQAFAAVGRDA
ncbi:MAG: NAD(P)H-hydrate dehydratase, partial [Planctomycetes bacterium]|nr:NAD(P)H-hydrate dehydratase [Planctomycetota bacterium]